MYQPSGGTYLKPSIGRLLGNAVGNEQKVLVVFTDGLDNIGSDGGDLASGKPSPWSTAALHAQLTAKQAEGEGWLCVYLGAFPNALGQGLACGFLEGNCLVFDKAHLAKAFETLRAGMQRFFTTSGEARRRLITSGLFR